MFLTALFIQETSIEERLLRRQCWEVKRGGEVGMLREAEYDSGAHGAYYGRVETQNVCKNYNGM